MQFHDKNIESLIHQITGQNTPQEHSLPPSTPSLTQIRNILLIATPYDYFLLEEEGRLSELFKQVYIKRDASYIPQIIQVNSGTEALEYITTHHPDLIVLFNIPRDTDLFTLAAELKTRHSDIPLIFLANNTPELERIQALKEATLFNWIFTWQGDGKIFLSIVSFVEDICNASSETQQFNTRNILLIESSIQHYSTYLQLLYDAIWQHIETLLLDELSQPQKILRQKRRPKILLATTEKQAKTLIDRYQNRLLFIIDGLSITEKIKQQEHQHTSNTLPPTLIIINTSKTKKPSTQDTITYLSKTNTNHMAELQEYINNNLGIKPLIFHDKTGKIITTAENIRTFEQVIWAIPGEILLTYAQQGILTRWLEQHTEFELAQTFHTIITKCLATTHPNTHIEHSLRKPLVEALNTHKYQTHQGTINTYSRDHYGPHIRFSRIGSGALGGKARALAFMDKIFTTYFSPSPFKNIHLFIPRTIVLSTNIFDSFIQQNNLLDIITESLPDDRIASRFMERDLPSTILGDLRNFIKEVRTPLAIRSSSLLEDALFQPFAGVYSSMMLPNYSHDLESRYKDLCNAIKFVYASTFFQKAVNYLHNSPHTVMDEKMGVVIQEVVGHTHDTIFYPTISGVARSYNYYPVNPCKNEDGVAFLALGMGKTIVDGGITYRSCPARPNVPHYSSIDELLKYSQTTFYAIDLTAKTTISHQEEDKSMTQHPLKTAEAHQELTYLASTYSPNDQQLYSGLSDVGPRVLDFAPILKDTAFPLAKIINLLLKTCEIAIGTPVEIEFAVNIDYTKTPPIEFALLQVRSMVATDDIVKVDITKIPSEHILCSCKKALGNGIITDIHDIIQVKPEHFDLSKTTTIVPEIRTLNEKLAKEHHPYLLVGPGRWGSTDQWLGIPVVWSDISGAKTIVETPVEQRIITPSEGSHFFQNLSSLRIGYFTIQSNTTDDYFNYEKLDSYPTIEETDLLRHIHLIKPLEIRIDGRSRQGIIILSPQ